MIVREIRGIGGDLVGHWRALFKGNQSDLSYVSVCNVFCDIHNSLLCIFIFAVFFDTRCSF